MNDFPTLREFALREPEVALRFPGIRALLTSKAGDKATGKAGDKAGDKGGR